VELVDPWEGSRTFAEDYDSGGDRSAPSLTPNHITPLAGTPGPAVVMDFPTLSDAGAHDDRLSPSSSVPFTSPSPKSHNVGDNDEIDELIQYGNNVATSVNNQEAIDERVVGSYYDPFAAVGLLLLYFLVTMSEISVDVTVHATEDIEASLETGDRDADRMQEIIPVPLSDDEHTDNDDEEDERKFSGFLPLGTSDLDIRDDWRDSGRCKDIDNISEEHKLQETVSSQTANYVAKVVASTLSKVANPSTLNGA